MTNRLTTMTDQDGRFVLAGLFVVFLFIPAILGLVSASVWWQSIEAETERQYWQAQEMYDPIPE